MESSNTLFDMVALMQEKNPFPPAVGADNAKELEFRNRGSSYTVATAGQKAGGRGSGVSYFHGSECSRWTNAPDHFASSVQAVDEVRGVWGVLWTKPRNPLPFEARMPEQIMGWARAPSEIWLETTSAGPTGEFHKRYKEGMRREGRFRSVFAPWTLTEEYVGTEMDFIPGEQVEEDGDISEAEYQQRHQLTDAQMLWRRDKIREVGSAGLFRQEYPVTVDEAFSDADIEGVFIKPSIILRASDPDRAKALGIPDAPLVVGVDPAGAGGDRFAIVWRRGDKCLKVEFRHKLEHDEAVAWIVSIIEDDKPARVCIDSGSMGRNIISSIRALDPNYSLIVRSIDFGGKSQAKLAMPNKSGPWNRRAEMWGRMRDWLKDGSIPNDDALIADLSGPRTKYRANNDWLLESKVEMKARGVGSPDLGDGLALTFAVQEYIPEWANEKIQTGFSSGRTETSRDYSSSSGNFRGGSNGWMA
jgi:hypothetical protein